MINLFDFESQMTRIIPSFAGFTEFTTSVPKIYWDVKSQEQRIHGICKLLHKCICYADMLGENVNEIAQTLKDIEDGKLDELITAAIAEWFEEHESQILQDITDLEARVKALEDENVLVYQAISDEHDARVYQDGLLAQDIADEANARILQDNKLKDYTSIRNDEYAFDKGFKLSNDKTNLFIENAEAMNAADYEDFTYAGKTLDEIFDNTANWALYVQPDTLSGYPVIGGVTPTATGECAYDADESYFAFDSTGAYEEQTAYLYWGSIPGTEGHRIALFATFELLDYVQGKCGFASVGAYSFGMNIENEKQIVGNTKVISGNNFTFYVGNLPQTTSVYIWETPIMKSNVTNLVVIDLDVLFADGETDEPSKFGQAYYLWCLSKENAATYRAQIKTQLRPTIEPEDAYDNFINLMNEYADTMQMINTQFNSASGLPRSYGSLLNDYTKNNFSTPIDMLRILLLASTDSYLFNIMTRRYQNNTFAQASLQTTIESSNSIIAPSSNADLAYKRIYGKGGSLSRSVTTPLCPYGIINNIAACTLKNGHIGYISLFDTPATDPGNGVVYDNMLRYYYCIQYALNQIISGTDPGSITYLTDLQNGIDLASQPTSFAAFIAPDGFDKASILSQGSSALLAWLNEAKVYLGNNDGTGVSDTQVITASCVKLLTAYIALQICDPNDTITLLDSDFIGGSTMGILSDNWKVNNVTITLKDAIGAMLYYSDNGLATAIARYAGEIYSGKALLGSSMLYFS